VVRVAAFIDALAGVAADIDPRRLPMSITATVAIAIVVPVADVVFVSVIAAAVVGVNA
jgi:hypothetical protein